MMPLSLIDLEISSGNGPEFARYSATTWLPGASEVLTHGFAFKPFAAALRASKPAAISTLGVEVLVHEVIAAITTSPWPRSNLRPSTGKRAFSSGFLYSFAIATEKPSATAGTATRPTGRFGPASEGTTSI